MHTSQLRQAKRELLRVIVREGSPCLIGYNQSRMGLIEDEQLTEDKIGTDVNRETHHTVCHAGSDQSRQDPDEPQQHDEDDESQLCARVDRLDPPAKLEDAVKADHNALDQNSESRLQKIGLLS